MIVFWMNLFYRNRLKDVSPAKLASSIRVPVMIIHGAQDRRFPVEFALRLKACFSPERSELFVAENARHSESSLDPGYAAAVRGFIERHLDGCRRHAEFAMKLVDRITACLLKNQGVERAPGKNLGSHAAAGIGGDRRTEA